MELKEAYEASFKKALEELKTEGIIDLKETAESAAFKVFDKLMNAIDEGATASEPLWDDFLRGVTPMIRVAIVPEIDKINPTDNVLA